MSESVASEDINAEIQRELEALSELSEFNDSVSDMDDADFDAEFHSIMKLHNTTSKPLDSQQKYLSTLQTFENLLCERDQAARKVVALLRDDNDNDVDSNDHENWDDREDASISVAPAAKESRLLESTEKQLDAELQAETVDGGGDTGQGTSSSAVPCRPEEMSSKGLFFQSAPLTATSNSVEMQRISRLDEMLRIAEEEKRAREEEDRQQEEERDLGRRQREEKMRMLEERRLQREEESKIAAEKRREAIRAAEEEERMRAEDRFASVMREKRKAETARLDRERSRMKFEDERGASLRIQMKKVAEMLEAQRKEQERLEKLRIDELKRKEEERKRAEEEKRRQEEESRRLLEEKQKKEALERAKERSRILGLFSMPARHAHSPNVHRPEIQVAAMKDSVPLTLTFVRPDAKCVRQLVRSPASLLYAGFCAWVSSDRTVVDGSAVVVPMSTLFTGTQAAPSAGQSATVRGSEDVPYGELSDPQQQPEQHNPFQTSQTLDSDLLTMHHPEIESLPAGSHPVIDLSCEAIASIHVSKSLLSALSNARPVSLSLNLNRLTDIPKQFIESVPFLEEVRFRDNQVDRLAPKLFEPCKSLVLVECSMNKLTNLEFLDANSNIRSIQANNNMIRSVQSLKGLAALNVLSLYRNCLISAALQTCQSFPALFSLDVGRNSLDRLEFSAFSKNSLLETLIAYRNSISAVDVRGFTNSLLSKVFLNGNSISGLAHLPCAPFIEELDFAENAISNASRELKYGPKATSFSFSPIYPIIRRFDVSFNRLHDYSALLWSILPCRMTLRRLDVHDNPVCQRPLFRSAVLCGLRGITNIDDAAVKRSERWAAWRRIVSRLRTSSMMRLLDSCAESNSRFVPVAHIFREHEQSSASKQVQQFSNGFAQFIKMSHRDRLELTSRHRRERTERLPGARPAPVAADFQQQQKHAAEEIRMRVRHLEETQRFLGKRQAELKMWSDKPLEARKLAVNVMRRNPSYVRARENASRSRAATSIQRIVRGFLVRQRVALQQQTNAAAVRIQAVIRGFLCRRQHPEVSAVLSRLHVLRSAAAVQIQKIFRGHRIRRIMARARFIDDDDEFPEVDVDLFIPKDSVFSLLTTESDMDNLDTEFEFEPMHLDSARSVMTPSHRSMHHAASFEIGAPHSGHDDEFPGRLHTSHSDTSSDVHTEILDDVGNVNNILSPRHKKEEKITKISEEWGFHEPGVAENMLKKYERYHKMQLQRQRRDELKDPAKRLELFKKRSAKNPVPAFAPSRKPPKASFSPAGSTASAVFPPL
eukprot:ANDGO_05183.mRNA.1 Internalin-A